MKSFCAIFLLLLTCLTAEAQTAADGPGASPRLLTWAEAKRVAVQNNWDLLAAKSDVDAATAQKIAAAEFPNPTLSLSTAHIPMDNNSGSPPSDNGFWGRNYDSIAAMNQLFEIGGKRTSRQESAAAGLKGAEARLLNAQRLLEQALTRAYIASLLADANAAILRQSAESLRKEAGIAGKRFKAGDISFSDKSQIEIAADRFELDAEAAKATALNARIVVENLMGVMNPAGAWRAAESLDDLARVLAPGLWNPGNPRPDMVAAEASLSKAEADLKLQKAMRIPDPTLLFQYEHAPPDQPNTVGFGFSFPLPLWNRNQGNILATEAARAQAEQQLNKNKAQISLEIANARSAYEISAARSRHYREEILPRSEEILKTVSFAYEKGGASLLDLLSAERTDNDVRLATALAAADAAGAAADLRAALNSPNEGTLNR